jgi:CheY-like chemotaxis protein
MANPRMNSDQASAILLASTVTRTFVPPGTDVAEMHQQCVTNTCQHKENTMAEYKSDAFFGALTGNGRVLVVDDEPSVRTIVRLVLEKAGYEVLEAENGATAIEALNTGENRLVLDVVISDIRMPKINGVQAIEYFQREYPHVPIIVLTAYPETKMAVSFVRSGVADYLIKPVDAQKLRDAVAKAMERRQVAWA